MPFPRFILALAVVALATLPAVALAAPADPINVKVNMARILKINAPAATVIIGNPSVADVTIQDPQTLVLTGKSFGQTNLIVLDTRGNAIADTTIDVVQEQADLMTIFQGPRRQSWACSPVCQPTIMLGDDIDYTAANVTSAASNAGTK